jgi:hypothetical protein
MDKEDKLIFCISGSTAIEGMLGETEGEKRDCRDEMETRMSTK